MSYLRLSWLVTAAFLLGVLMANPAALAAAPGKKKGVKPAAYSLREMRTVYTQFDKSSIKPKNKIWTLRDVAAAWQKKYTIKFGQTTDMRKKHKNWGRVAFVSPSKADKCLKLYYYYAADSRQTGKGPEKTIVKGGVKNASCSAAADYGVSVQYPAKL